MYKVNKWTKTSQVESLTLLQPPWWKSLAQKVRKGPHLSHLRLSRSRSCPVENRLQYKVGLFHSIHVPCEKKAEIKSGSKSTHRIGHLLDNDVHKLQVSLLPVKYKQLFLVLYIPYLMLVLNLAILLLCIKSQDCKITKFQYNFIMFTTAKKK